VCLGKAGRRRGERAGCRRGERACTRPVADLRRDATRDRGPAMTVALWLLTIQGVIGAFDTIYFHEWRARLPARGAQAAPELKLHAWRSFLYALIFGSLPWLAWQGAWVLALAGVLLAEIGFTMADFVVEIAVRKPLGDVYSGERDND